MSTMQEMAQEYRVTAAKLSVCIARHRASGDRSEEELRVLKQALRDVREVGQLLSCYYTAPRRGSRITLLGLTPRRTRDDH